MGLDPIAAVLCVIALAPRGLLRWWLRTPAWAHAVGIAAVAAAVGLGLTPLFPIAQLLTHLLLFRWAVLALARGRHRWAPLVTVGAIWTFVVASGTPMIGAHGPAQFWLVDLSNRFILAWLVPAMAALGVEDALPALIGYLNHPLVFVSHYLVALHLVGSLCLALLGYALVRARTGALPPRPELLARSLAPRWTAALVAVGLAHAAWPELVPLEACWRMGLGLFAWRGLLLTHRLCYPQRLTRRAFWLLALLMILQPGLLAIMVALAALDGPLGLSETTGAWSSVHGRLRTRLHGLAGQMSRGLAVALVAAMAVPFLYAGRLTHTRLPEPLTPRPDEIRLTQDMSTMAWDGAPVVRMDRFEFPNRPLSKPQTFLSLGDARDRCAGVGKRLCTATEWTLACSDGHMKARLFEDLRTQRERCNLTSNALERGALRAANPMSPCATDAGVIDLVGNAFEWVESERADGFLTLAGSFYGYADDLTTACHHRTLVHPAQLEVLPRRAIGARCCR